MMATVAEIVAEAVEASERGGCLCGDQETCILADDAGDGFGLRQTPLLHEHLERAESAAAATTRMARVSTAPLTPSRRLVYRAHIPPGGYISSPEKCSQSSPIARIGISCSPRSSHWSGRGWRRLRSDFWLMTSPVVTRASCSAPRSRSRWPPISGSRP